MKHQFPSKISILEKLDGGFLKLQFNSGIGDSKHEVTLNYCENVSGSMSTIPDLNQKFYKTHQEHYTFINTQVSILDIFEEINKIKSVHKRNPVFCKIDCEGYEGRIIERLYSTDSLCKINLLMMECHDKPIKNKIITMLLEKKFTCYDFEINGYSNSMLYAYR